MSFWLQALGKLGAEPDACDIEEGMAVDRAEVDFAGVAFKDDIGGLKQIHWDVERAGKIVGRAHRNDAERQPALHDGERARGDGAVAPAQNDEIGAFAQPNDIACNFGQCVKRLYRDVEPASVEASDNGVDRFAAAAGLRIDEKQRPFLGLGQGSQCFPIQLGLGGGPKKCRRGGGDDHGGFTTNDAAARRGG